MGSRTDLNHLALQHMERRTETGGTYQIDVLIYQFRKWKVSSTWAMLTSLGVQGRNSLINAITQLHAVTETYCRALTRMNVNLRSRPRTRQQSSVSVYRVYSVTNVTLAMRKISKKTLRNFIC
jgi:hypothetical protein